MNTSIRAWDTERDTDAGFNVWSAALGTTWPVAEDDFRRRAREGIVALQDGRIVGVVLIDSSSRLAGIMAILVLPELRAQGIGTALHSAGVEALRDAGLQRIGLGGGFHYFWPGVPGDLPRARAFFERRGWSFEATTWDLARDLRGFQTPAEVIERGRRAGFECRAARPEERHAVVSFEETHFAPWAPYFRAEKEAGRMIILIDGSGTVQGSLLIEHPPGRRPLWSLLLGANAGAIGAVGVAEAAREQGAGTALVAKACEVLRDAGVGNCHIGWTNLLSFYGRLGFRPWREYGLSRRLIEPRRRGPRLVCAGPAGEQAREVDRLPHYSSPWQNRGPGERSFVGE